MVVVHRLPPSICSGREAVHWTLVTAPVEETARVVVDKEGVRAIAVLPLADGIHVDADIVLATRGVGELAPPPICIARDGNGFAVRTGVGVDAIAVDVGTERCRLSGSRDAD